jgi:hypothetical protein
MKKLYISLSTAVMVSLAANILWAQTGVTGGTSGGIGTGTYNSAPITNPTGTNIVTTPGSTASPDGYGIYGSDNGVNTPSITTPGGVGNTNGYNTSPGSLNSNTAGSTGIPASGNMNTTPGANGMPSTGIPNTTPGGTSLPAGVMSSGSNPNGF